MAIDTEPQAPIRDRTLPSRRVALVAVVVTAPLVWLGYGTDIDVRNVLNTASRIRGGGYEPSRPPGLPVFEVIVAVLEPLGGHILVNLATAGAAIITVVGISLLVRAWGHANGDLVALAFLASPVFIVAATSMVDLVWALMFLVLGMLVHVGVVSAVPQRHRDVFAGVLFALAIGTRLTTAFLVAAFLVAEGWDPARRRACQRVAFVSVPLAVLLFVPSWLSVGRTLEFLEPAEEFRGLVPNMGAFAYKNFMTAGIAFLVVTIVALPGLLRALLRWQDDPMLRFGVLALGVTESLYFLAPWKLGHLLPALLGLLLWLGTSSRARSRTFLWVAVAAVALNGVVAFRLLTPDEPGHATSGSWTPEWSAGFLLNDILCRVEHMDDPPTRANVNAAWDCTMSLISGPSDEADQTDD